MQSAAKIRIIVTEDHKMVRQGLIACLGECANIEIIAEGANGLEAIAKYRQFLPDVLLMDISMPEMNGIEATRVLLNEFPNAKILILSAHKETEYIVKIAKSGAMGYVLKDTSTEELVKAIENVYTGKKHFDVDIAAILVEASSPVKKTFPTSSVLTAREIEVLILITEGFITKEIADRLCLSPKTIGVHREHIMEKLDIRTAAGLAKYAIEAGLVKTKKIK